MHLVHETVPTPWERKGAVMRELIEHPPPGELVLIDGVKVVNPDGWASCCPTPKTPTPTSGPRPPTRPEARQLGRGAVRRSSAGLSARVRRHPSGETPWTYPSDRHYSAEHEWVTVAGDEARVGITDFAQDSLGDVVFVQLPDVGLEVVADASCAEVESTKSVSEIYSPVSGVITAVNTALDDQPEQLNQDPYGAGWIFALRVADPGELDALLDAAAYQQLVESG